MKKRYKHLRYEERVKIEVLRQSGKSIRAVARMLGRSPNTISYELTNKQVKGECIAKKAQVKSYQKRYHSKRGCLKIAMDKNLQQFVHTCLRQYWSPERISGFVKRFGYSVSTKAIYKYIRSRSLERYLFWSWNKKKTGRKRYPHGNANDGRRYIDVRPKVVSSGHFEADFIVSSKSTYVLLVVVDIHTRLTFIRKLPNRKHATVLRAFSRVFKDKTVRSLTLDNDIAFNCWKTLEGHLKTTIYFTHPYSSWEKGLVENTNRWIRCFVPKRTDINDVSFAELQNIQSWLNSSPRQCLGFRSSLEIQLQD